MIGALIRDTRALTRKTDDRRKIEKEPHLIAGRQVDAFFSTLTDRLDRITATFQKIADDHARKAAAEARTKAEAEARKAREEEARQRDIAERAQEANRVKTADKAAIKADDAAERAQEADKAASASAADLTRTRTASGVLSTARTEWKGKIVDYAKVDLEALRPYIKREALDAALAQAVRNGVRAIGGTEIAEDVKASFR